MTFLPESLDDDTTRANRHGPFGAGWERADWDAAADAFDDEPDHGLRDATVRAAWADRLRGWLPGGPSDVLDLGCGTGSLSLLAAEQGHRVTGVDLAPRMVERARAKLAAGAPGSGAEILTGDAAAPPVGERRFDVVLARHVLWTLPDPEATLRHWCSLLRPGGRLVLVEGVWGDLSPVGLPARRLTAALGPLVTRVHTEDLTGDARLWGKEVTDERYALVGTLAAASPRHTEVVDVHLLLRRGDEILLARRAGTGYADGLLHAPSGHVEDGEDVRAAMIREAREEIGLALTPDDLRVVLVMQHRGPGGRPRVGWFFEATYGAGGEPYNAEPDKCAELTWSALDTLPDDMVAYCRAGLESYRKGDRFVLHWHTDEDPITYDTTTDRAVALPETPPPGGVHHVELWVPDLASAEASWHWLLTRLGHVPYQSWEHGRSWRRGPSYVVIEQSPALTGATHDRLSPGLNHFALHAGSRAAVDALVREAPEHGWTLLFPERHPYAGGDAHYAAYLTDRQGYEVEVVAR
ncbi:trifunctional class I SAM-dependent methyltransferase/NUDIX hydrolase/VOC family protein [Streptomyces sp. NPDC058001]|uniref:trifunctional class I SAM-dependent methyltransferase/NUDIX hydrolase/VOC family protein n=1 Tax=Streptomyces sp. NPDC058001 TaxID=3346300 RepID=UPI0036EF61BF